MLDAPRISEVSLCGEQARVKEHIDTGQNCDRTKNDGPPTAEIERGRPPFDAYSHFPFPNSVRSNDHQTHAREVFPAYLHQRDLPPAAPNGVAADSRAQPQADLPMGPAGPTAAWAARAAPACGAARPRDGPLRYCANISWSTCSARESVACVSRPRRRIKRSWSTVRI